MAGTDMYCETFDEVIEEVTRRRKVRGTDTAGALITKYEETPYGGYRVYSIPADLVVDDLVDPSLPNANRGSFRLYR